MTDEQLNGRFDGLAYLIQVLIGQINDRIDGINARIYTGLRDITARFDTQAARLERHAGLLQIGNRWTARMNDWAEKVDQALETKDREIAELRARLEKLERPDGANP
jgi:hypothetical protein